MMNPHLTPPGVFHLLFIFLAYLAFSATASPNPLPQRNNNNNNNNRNSNTSPDFYNSAAFTSQHDNGTYAPDKIRCPPAPRGGWIRDAGGSNSSGYASISESEASYIRSRKNEQTNPALRSFLRAQNISSADVDRIFNGTNAPITGVAFSGGGYRALLNAAGLFKEMDNRTSSSRSPAAGLLQGMDYMAGTSGGSWLVASSAVHDFATVETLNDSVWDLQRNLVTNERRGQGEISSWVAAVRYFGDIYGQVRGKEDKGFDTGLTDYWSLALGRHLLNRDNGSPNTVLSNITLNPSFINHTLPFPLILADGRRPDERIVSRNATLYEFNPYEFGSWDQNQTFFFPMRYLGTNMTNNRPTNDRECVVKFDSVDYVMGTSSSIFNVALADQLRRANSSRIGGDEAIGGIQGADNARVNDIRADALRNVVSNNGDVASYPNPFRAYQPRRNPTANSSSLSLADGGSDGQNIPLVPLLQPARAVDFILAVDSSSNTDTNFPNGSSLWNTYQRIQENKTYHESIGFPKIPRPETFVKLGLNRRPVFFGCRAQGRNSTSLPSSSVGPSNRNSTSASSNLGPLIAYLPNTPLTYFTNSSTYALNYTGTEINSFFDNSAAQLLRPLTPASANSSSPKQTRQGEFLTCLACAVVARSKERAGIQQGAQCERCFREWCWDESMDTSAGAGRNNTSAPYEGLGNGSKERAVNTGGQGRQGGGRSGGEGFFGSLFRDRRGEGGFF